jgi:hypothetical protein
MPERWLDPGIAGLRAELCQVQSTGEEFALLFGTHAGGAARLERRILLSPLLAKQLAATLANLARDPNATPAGASESAASDAWCARSASASASRSLSSSAREACRTSA